VLLTKVKLFSLGTGNTLDICDRGVTPQGNKSHKHRYVLESKSELEILCHYALTSLPLYLKIKNLDALTVPGLE